VNRGLTVFLFCSPVNSCIGFYSGLSGRVRTVYLFSLCVVSLLSSRFSAKALAWFSNLLQCFVFHFFISLITVFFCRSSWILWLRSESIGESWIENGGGFRCWNWKLSP
jgi:hypothetical protein